MPASPVRRDRSPSPPPPGRPPARDMVWIPGGGFQMGSDHHYPEEAPAHPVSVPGFWIDRGPVTNAQFLRFVKATGYRTLAERPADPALYPEARPELLAPASIVFVPPPRPVDQGNIHAWWRYVPGAHWRHPEGPGSSLKGREQHPVVHIACEDAEAYARWIGKALPSEAEWERAARGGLEGTEFAWGDSLYPGGRCLANTFQGDFPHRNSRQDGWERTSPVGAFPANGFGLLDMIGNVWEWTSDWYQPHGARFALAGPAGSAGGCCAALPDSPLHDPRGGERAASIDPAGPHGTMPRRVVKGGSFLCAPDYCRRYRPAARMAQGIDTSTCHLGFRCVVRPEPQR